VLSEEYASPDAALHIGPQFVISETAALDAAAAVAGTDQLQGVSEHVMFLARGKDGPFRVQADPIAGAGGTVGVQVLLYDEGNGDRLITAGSYTFTTAS
jgi:acyl-coenzyme A thioesterase PaaI-like protein